MSLYLLVALGGAIGSVGRFFISGLAAHSFGSAFPWGTFIVNVVGSFGIAFFATLTGPDGRFLVGGSGRQFFMTGVCGGFTTFSSFSLQTLTLAQEGEWLYAGGNVIGSVVTCLAGAWLGYVCAMVLNQVKG